MILSKWSRLAGRPALTVIVLILFAQSSAFGQDKQKPDLTKVPKIVMDGLKAKFPKAEIVKCTQEMENDTLIHDFEFTQEGSKFEADVREDGSIHNWEMEFKAKDVPEAVWKAVEARYPKSTAVVIMGTMIPKEGKDVLEGYEITLTTVDKKTAEILIAPDGKVLEDSSDEHLGSTTEEGENK